MRPYRGQTKQGRWVYGWYCEVGGIDYIIEEPTPMTQTQYGSCLPEDDLVEVIPSTVGQSTGLKDKNGKEIYEGDIVQGIWQCDHKSIRTGIVKYWEQYGLYGLDKNAALVSVVWKGCEIIGNTHENPELLEQQ